MGWLLVGYICAFIVILAADGCGVEFSFVRQL
jgi:hypothetical protein